MIVGVRMANVKRNFAYNSAYRLLMAVTPLITTPYLSRVIGAEGNGLYTYTQAVTNYFVLAAMLGMENYGVRAIAECGDDRDRRSRVFWEAFSMNAIVGVVVLAAYVGYACTFGRDYMPLWVFWGMWVVGSIIDVTWLLFGMQEFRIPTIRSFCTRLASVAFVFLFVRSPNDVWAYVAAIAGAYLLNALLVWPYVRRYVDMMRPSWSGMLSHLKPNLILFVPVVAASLYLIMDKVMLGSMSGMFEAGCYDYAEKVSKMPMSVITALGAVILPKMTAVIAQGRDEEAHGLVGDTMWFMQACAMALSFGIAAVTPEFVPVFLGEGYDPCVLLLRLLCVIVPIVCASNVLGVQWLLPTKRDKLYTMSVVAGAVVNILINAALIPSLGAVGASVATVAAELAVLVVQAVSLRKDLPIARYVLGAVPFAVIGAVMLGLIRVCSHMLGAQACTVWGLAIEVALGGCVYVLLAYGWCRATRSPQLKRILPRAARW